MSDDKWMSQVKRGLLELCILNLVAHEEMYGYQIVKRVADGTGLVVTVGTIYPLLSRLKREGHLKSSLVASDRGPARRNYQLTPSGRRHLTSINDAWQTITEAVEGFQTPPDTKRSRDEAP